MFLTITNFGPISKFEYDLSKDLIVVYGDNNIGKSYAMQLVYLILKNLREYAQDWIARENQWHLFFHSQLPAGFLDRFLENDGLKSMIEAGVNRIRDTDISENIDSLIKKDILSHFIKNLRNSCENTFGNFERILEGSPEIVLQTENTEFIFTFSNISGVLYPCPTFLKFSSGFCGLKREKDCLDVYYQDNDTLFSGILETVLSGQAKIAADILSSIGDVYFLPASRSGIYTGMSAVSGVVAELSKNRNQVKKKVELPGISEPVADYFLAISTLKARTNKTFVGICARIEQDILRGTVRFDGRNKKLVYITEESSSEFQMTEVSSMVSEVAPIVAFLKFIIKPSKEKNAKPVIFIEEPEAHLHPHNQIQLITLFAQLHQYGVKVIISSHSNYIFNKLNNLLLSGDLTPDMYSAILLEETDNGGSVSSFMNMDELGVDDLNFLDIAQSLYEEREALIEKINEQAIAEDLEQNEKRE